jgi:hypothetical protein
MADENIGRLVSELNREIQKGVDLFKLYKKMSKEFQNRQIILRNSTELLMEFNKLKKKYENDVEAAKIEKNMKLREEALETLKKTYDKQLKIIKEKSEESEKKLVNSEKKFLKGKENIRKFKKRILTKILDIRKEIRSKMDIKEFNAFINRFQKRKYEVLDGKKISFDTLMNHLKSGEISEEVAKTTKQIDELMTIGNVVNRKKRMEIGIKQKEIENLSKNYEKTNKLAKESVKKEITKLVKSLNGISNAKEKEKVTTKIDRLSRSLKNEMTERQRKIKYDIQIKRQELKELKKSS